MVNVLLCIVSVIITVIFAGLLVSWQNKQEDISRKLDEEFTNNFGEAVIDYTSLTRENLEEESIYFLEKGIECFSNRLPQSNIVIKNKDTRRRRKRHVKHKKNSTDD